MKLPAVLRRQAVPADPYAEVYNAEHADEPHRCLWCTDDLSVLDKLDGLDTRRPR